jgi:hypothetical protein
MPCSSLDILASVTSKTKCAAPKQTVFEGEILQFVPPSTPGLSTSASTSTEGRDSFVSAGSSHSAFSLSFQPPMTSNSFLGLPFITRQQGDAHRGRCQSRSRLDFGTMLACSVLVPDTNKHLLCSPRSLSDPSNASGDKTRAPRMLCAERFTGAIDLLKGRQLSPFDLILEILDDNNSDYTEYRIELYKDKSSKLLRILDSILASHSGKQKLWSWMRLHALALVCEVIDEEMDTVTKEELLPGLSAITPDFIKSWEVADFCECAPFLSGVLIRAAQTALAQERNEKKHPQAVCIEYITNIRVLILLHVPDVQRHRETIVLSSLWSCAGFSCSIWSLSLELWVLAADH